MDPVTIIGLVEGSISLAVKCGSVAKSLNNIAGQYKSAKLTLSTMVQNLDIMQLAWHRIAVWSKDHVFTDNDNLKGRLERFLETGVLVLDALEEDVRYYDAPKLTFHQRSRLVWNEGRLQAHQTRIRDQAQSMSLLLQAVQLPTIQGTAELLQQSQKQFLKSDESAFSIVPSRMSSRVSLSTIQTSDGDSVRSSASLVYHPFSFENDLFTARVYKRNYRTSNYQGSRKQKPDRDVEAVDPRKENIQSSELAGSSVLDQSTTISDRNVLTDQEYGDFIEACRKGDKDEVSKVLNSSSIYGSSVAPNLLFSRKCDSVHLCPFHATVYGGHLEVMETLLQHAHLEHIGNPVSLLFCTGGPVMVDGGKQRIVPPLHFAAYKGDISMVQLLLRMGAPVNAESDHGVQAIHSAAKKGSIKVLAVLIAAGASVNCRDHKGRQPMHYLSEIQRPEVIEYLAGKGAEIDGVSDTSPITPLGFACRNGIDANAKALLSLGALVTSPILDAAVKDGPIFMVETLLNSAASQKQGQSVVVASLRKFLSTLEGKRTKASDEDVEKLSFLLRHTDLLARDHNGDPIFHSLFRWPGPDERNLSGSIYDFIPYYYISGWPLWSEDATRLEEAFIAGFEIHLTHVAPFSYPSSQYYRAFYQAFSTNRESGPTSASALSDVSSQYCQDNKPPFANRESGPTGACASSDKPPRQNRPYPVRSQAFTSQRRVYSTTSLPQRSHSDGSLYNHQKERNHQDKDNSRDHSATAQ